MGIIGISGAFPGRYPVGILISTARSGILLRGSWVQNTYRGSVRHPPPGSALRLTVTISCIFGLSCGNGLLGYSGCAPGVQTR